MAFYLSYIRTKLDETQKHTGNEFEKRNAELRAQVRNQSAEWDTTAEKKIQPASVPGQRASAPETTNANVILNKYLEGLPPSDHSWTPVKDDDAAHTGFAMVDAVKTGNPYVTSCR